MKNKTLIYLLLGAGALYLIAAKKKPKGYKIIVPEPEKITKEQFEKPSLIQKAAPVIKKLATAIKKKKADQTKQKAVKAFLQKFAPKQVGNFPDIY